MNKSDIKNILISIRKPENEHIVNYLLGQVDMKDDESISRVAESLGNDETNIRNFLLKKIQEKQEQQSNDERYPINDMFTYGISGNCIHLHLPTDLHELMAKNGISKTIALVNLQLLDAIDKIKEMRDGGFYRFKDKDSIYMISPAVIKREMKFLEELDFTTNSYSKKQLSDEKFVQEVDCASFDDVANILLDKLISLDIIKSSFEINAVGHKVIHGKDLFDNGVLLGENVMEKCIWNCWILIQIKKKNG
mgnify:CR=1 FL=1